MIRFVISAVNFFLPTFLFLRYAFAIHSQVVPPFVFYLLLKILLSSVRVTNFAQNVLDSGLDYLSFLTSFIRVESSSNDTTQLTAQVFTQPQLACHLFALTIG